MHAKLVKIALLIIFFNQNLSLASVQETVSFDKKIFQQWITEVYQRTLDGILKSTNSQQPPTKEVLDRALRHSCNKQTFDITRDISFSFEPMSSTHVKRKYMDVAHGFPMAYHQDLVAATRDFALPYWERASLGLFRFVPALERDRALEHGIIYNTCGSTKFMAEAAHGYAYNFGFSKRHGGMSSIICVPSDLNSSATPRRQAWDAATQLHTPTHETGHFGIHHPMDKGSFFDLFPQNRTCSLEFTIMYTRGRNCTAQGGTIPGQVNTPRILDRAFSLILANNSINGHHGSAEMITFTREQVQHLQPLFDEVGVSFDEGVTENLQMMPYMSNFLSAALVSFTSELLGAHVFKKMISHPDSRFILGLMVQEIAFVGMRSLLTEGTLVVPELSELTLPVAGFMMTRFYDSWRRQQLINHVGSGHLQRLLSVATHPVIVGLLLTSLESLASFLKDQVFHTTHLIKPALSYVSSSVGAYVGSLMGKAANKLQRTQKPLEESIPLPHEGV